MKVRGRRPGSTTADVAIFVSNRAYGLTSSRLWLVERFVEEGWDVVAAGASDPTVDALRDAGAEFVPVPFRRGGVDPIRDVQALRALASLYRELRPRLVHHFNTKPILLGGLAASGLVGTRVVNTVTGLGYGLAGSSWLSWILRRLYARVLPHSSATIFQNADDRDYFVDRGLVRESRTHLVPSSGVEMDRFRPSKETDDADSVTVLLAGRLVWQKGIREYAEAAEQLRGLHPDTRFCLAGESDPGHPDAVPETWIREREKAGTWEYLGYLDDMPRALQEVDLLVAPSTFREGFPRVLLEASAAGVPIVASDLPGCREAVVDGETGLLVDPGNVTDLVRAVDRLLRDADERARMSRAARRHVEERFSRDRVIASTLDVLSGIGIELGGSARPSSPGKDVR